MKGRLLLAVVLIGCGSSPKKEPAPPPNPNPTPAPVGDNTPAPAPAPSPTPTSTQTAKSLYERLGGQPAVTAVVNEFVSRTTTDPRIKERFFNTDADNLKKLLVEFVCMAGGGGCKYTGRSMEESHAGMGLVEEEFNALVEDLVGALDKFKVPEKEKGELLGALGPLKPAMVVAADKLKPIPEKDLAKVTKLAGTIKDKGAQDLLNFAVVVGKRGQRSYAEQLFSRAEMITGPKPLASVASVFRAGAPTRVTTATKKLPADSPAQPKTVGGSEADEPDKTPAKGQLTGQLTVDGKPATSMGVVMLFPEKGGKKRTPKTRIVEQRGKQFAPQITAVPVGSTISFPNFDPIYHNVFSLSKAKPFDLGMYKSGESRDVKLDKPGIIRLGCNLHASMSAYIIAVDAPHYVVAQGGTFEFKSLAPGKYKVEAWTENSATPVTASVTIKEGANQTAIDLKGGAAKTSPDKFGTARE